MKKYTKSVIDMDCHSIFYNISNALKYIIKYAQKSQLTFNDINLMQLKIASCIK